MYLDVYVITTCTHDCTQLPPLEGRAANPPMLELAEDISPRPRPPLHSLASSSQPHTLTPSQPHHSLGGGSGVQGGGGGVGGGGGGGGGGEGSMTISSSVRARILSKLHRAQVYNYVYTCIIHDVPKTAVHVVG